ncbi:citrate transporter [Sporosarcina globispora]|uniref:Citrate transporter n=1 Tax=Sporosarcina globispora TaxID=1459 RepID=A0A0M0G8I1_SPOGL|nr:GntP family permease [Sporosarcina globispora]KON86210.1 citrate transporter [Sporosarcina globispora]
MIGMLGLIASLILLMYLTMKGVNIIIAAIISAVVVALTGGLNLETALTEHYMTGFTNYFYSWFLIFLLGAVFGKIMQVTKAADSIAIWVKDTLDPSKAVFAVVAAAAIMTYGGVSLFVVGFAVYPIAVSLFKVANLPHRFIPAALVFGSISFTMTAPGSPEIQNLIPTEFFGTKPTAGGIIGVLMAIIIMVTGGILLSRMVKKAVQNGEVFSLPNQSSNEETAAALEEELEMQRPNAASSGNDYPNVILAILPLAAVIAILNTAANFTSSTAAALISLTSGIVLACILMMKYLVGFWEALAKGAQDALVAAANTCAVVGFGSVAAQVAAFDTFVDALVNIPGPPLMGLAIAVTLICGITGSASGGLGIALPILAPMYMSQGLDPGAMHRISALASGGLDSLPHNGYVVTTIRAICGETHKRAYWPIFILSAAMPTVVLFLAVILYSIF